MKGVMGKLELVANIHRSAFAYFASCKCRFWYLLFRCSHHKPFVARMYGRISYQALLIVQRSAQADLYVLRKLQDDECGIFGDRREAFDGCYTHFLQTNF